MKKYICLALALCLAISLTGCLKHADEQPFPSETVNNPTQSSSPVTNSGGAEETMIAVSVPTTTENLKSTDGTVLFQYTYPHLSLVLHKPDIADKIILNFLNRVDSTRASAQSVSDMAKTAYHGAENWIPYLYHLTYNPMRVDQNVISLFGNTVVFSGTAHPERTCVSVSYDLATGDILTLAAIMTKNATGDDFCKLVLDGLSDRAEGDFLYENYADTVKQRFRVDFSEDEAWYFTQSGLCFYFEPYQIAPYTSGVITVEIPYEKLKGILHDAYFPAAHQATTGTLTVSSFDTIDLTNFSHIAELIANKDGQMLMVYPDTKVQNIRILYSDSTGTYTMFAADTLSPGDGIMIQATEEMLKKMEISYLSGDDTVTISVVK